VSGPRDDPPAGHRPLSVLVTGATSGIGEGIARHLVALGHLVTVVGRRADRIDTLGRQLGERVRGVVGDVADAADRARMVDAAVAHGDGLDSLVNNAGIMYRSPLTELDAARLHDVFDVNVIGPLLLTGLAVPHLESAPGGYGGCVVFMGSVHTQRAFPGAAPYAATKGALETLTGVLAAELGPKQIRVSCIRPGAVPSEINVAAGLATVEENLERLQGLGPAHALGRIGTVTDVAEATAYLLTANWVTGSVLTVDGGLSLGVTNA